MKPSLERDFTVSVRHQILEELPEVAEYYRGIYSVTLNFLVTVMFVPEFEKTGNNEFSHIPENIDKVKTEFDARLFTVALSDYAVTSNSFLAGQQELFPLPSAPEEMKNSGNVAEMGVLFYVSPQEFESFSKELSVLAARTLGVHDYVRISELQNLEFAKFILSTVIRSQHFATSHLRLLGREYEYAQKTKGE